jgi:hypothetical protein
MWGAGRRRKTPTLEEIIEHHLQQQQLQQAGSAPPTLRKRRLRPEQVKTEIAERSAQEARHLADASSVPEETFAPCDSGVEDSLLNGVLGLILRSFERDTGTAPHAPRADELCREERIGDADVDAFLRAFASWPAAAPPQLDEGLAGERLWILVDLARNGPGLSRQRATRELRETMGSLWHAEGIDQFFLQQLVDLLGQVAQTGESSVLFQMLRMSAAGALAQKRRPVL